MTRLRSLLAALVFTASLPACTSRGSQESCIKSTAHAPVVKLIDAGQEPRAPMRLAIASDQKEVMAMTMKMAMAMDGVQKLPHTRLPAMVMNMGLAVTEVNAHGDFRYDFTLDAVDVVAGDSPPAMVEALRTALGAMKGITGHSRLTSRAEVCEASVKVPDAVPPQLKQTMDGLQQSMAQISVPFPEEPVGVGARWEVSTRLANQGVDLNQTTTYEIVERTPTTVKVATKITQRAAPQKMNPPGLPPGAVVNLESLDSSGSGTTVFDLTRVVPQDGQVIMATKMAMTIEMMGQKQAMSMDMDLDVAIAPGK